MWCVPQGSKKDTGTIETYKQKPLEQPAETAGLATTKDKSCISQSDVTVEELINGSQRHSTETVHSDRVNTNSGKRDRSNKSIKSKTETCVNKTKDVDRPGFHIVIDFEKLGDLILDESEHDKDKGRSRVNGFSPSQQITAKGLSINKLNTSFNDKPSFLQYEKKRVSLYQDDSNEDDLEAKPTAHRSRYNGFYTKMINSVHMRDFRQAVACLPPRNTIRYAVSVQRTQNYSNFKQLTEEQQKKVKSMANIYTQPVRRRVAVIRSSSAKKRPSVPVRSASPKRSEQSNMVLYSKLPPLVKHYTP